MRIAVFLLCFFSFLLRINDHAFAGVRHESISYGQAQRIKKNLQTKLISKDQAAFSEADMDTAPEWLLNDDTEDEDPSPVITRKYVPPVRYFSYYFRQLLLSYSFNRFKAPPSYRGQVSYKYLLLGVLRL